MLSALLISLTVAWLTWTLTSSLPILFLTLLAGFLFTFTVTPHLVAYWLNIHVDVLLGMPDPPPIHR